LVILTTAESLLPVIHSWNGKIFEHTKKTGLIGPPAIIKLKKLWKSRRDKAGQNPEKRVLELSERAIERVLDMRQAEEIGLLIACPGSSFWVRKAIRILLIMSGAGNSVLF